MRYQTLRGIPLVFEFQWPVHPSHSGSDWFVLHGKATVEDGSGLHADVAVNMSRSVVNALPSLEPQDASSVAINAVRKFVDTRDLEFLKSGKRQPVNASSRVYSIVQNKWTFNDVSDDQLRDWIERKVYWDCVHGGNTNTWLYDPVEAQYFNSQSERLVNVAKQLGSSGLIQLDGDLASATDKLRANSERYTQVLRTALEDLEAKHAYERA
jgi:hypothetical protein